MTEAALRAERASDSAEPYLAGSRSPCSLAAVAPFASVSRIDRAPTDEDAHQSIKRLAAESHWGVRID